MSGFIDQARLPEHLQKELQDFYEFLLIKASEILTGKNKLAKERKAGFLAGVFKLEADFDKPLEDFKEYTE